MHIAEVMEILTAVSGARARVRAIEARLDEVRERAERITGAPDGGLGLRVQSGRTSDPVGTAGAALADLRDELATRVMAEMQTIREAESMISRVMDPQLRDVLTWRYINCWPWWRVADAAGVSERWIYELREKAHAAVIAANKKAPG